MDEKFSQFFFDFCTLNRVYLITGSDKPKTVEQIGNVIYGVVKRVYQCAGAEVYEKELSVSKSDWEASPDLIKACKKELVSNEFPLRTGNHIEQRVGLLNFSIIGRNCTLGERKLYVKYDEENNDREKIARRLRKSFSDIEFKVAGETGIDITPKGGDKSQILKDFDSYDHIYFFGDKTSPGGNDYEIYEAINDMPCGKSFAVNGWKETWSTLKSL